jgi:hypothetical protein
MRLLLTALLVLFFTLALAGQNQSHANESSGNAQQKTADSNEALSNDAQMSTVRAEHCWRHEQQASNQEASIFGFTRFELTIACLTLVYVLLTGFYACISYKTLDKIKEQIKLAERSAKAAEDAATASMDTEQAILWIEQVFHWNEITRSFFQMRVWNSGKTVGTVFAGNGALQIGEIDAPPDPSVFNYQPRDRFNELIADPDSQTPTNLAGVLQRDGPLTVEEKDSIAAGTKYLWACGYFRYRDIFKRTFERRYCYRFTSYDLLPSAGPKGEFRVAGPPDYNRLTRCDEQ